MQLFIWKFSKYPAHPISFKFDIEGISMYRWSNGKPRLLLRELPLESTTTLCLDTWVSILREIIDNIIAFTLELINKKEKSIKIAVLQIFKLAWNLKFSSDTKQSFYFRGY